MMASSANSNPGCACGNLRRATRLVTQLYDNALKPTGLLVTQYGLLCAIKRMQPATINELVSWMVMDRTTLGRNLGPLEKQGLIRIQSGEDKRTRVISITPKAEKILVKALPLWETAQSQFVDIIGPKESARLEASLAHVVGCLRP